MLSEINREKMERAVQAFQFVFNILNHICIIVVSVHVTWYCYLMILSGKFTVQYHLHVWMSTIGYQLLMAEAIMTLYSSNCWSFIYAPKTKRTIHWIMQVVGSSLAIIGTVILYPTRKTHFKTIHSITGLISLVFAAIGCINGIAAINPHSVYRKYRIRPVVSKLFHNFVGLSSFVLGMVSLYYGYMYRYFSADYGLPDIQVDFSPWQMASVIATTILSLFGAFTAFYGQIRATLGI